MKKCKRNYRMKKMRGKRRKFANERMARWTIDGTIRHAVGISLHVSGQVAGGSDNPNPAPRLLTDEAWHKLTHYTDAPHVEVHSFRTLEMLRAHPVLGPYYRGEGVDT